MQLALAEPDFAVGVEKHRGVERLLVAEIVIEQPLVGGGALGDAVDARAVEAELAEFLARGDQDVALGERRVALAWRPPRRCGGLGLDRRD